MTALSHVCLDDGPTGMQSNFKHTVVLLLPNDPVTKKRGAKCPGAEILAVEAPDPKGGKGGKRVTFKQMTGKTGVEFRYYKKAKFKQLSQLQEDELREHLKENGIYQSTWTGKGGAGPD